MGLPWFLPWGYHCSTARSCPPLEQNFTERDVTKVVRPMRSVSCATQDTNINKTFRPTVIPPTQLVTKKFGWRAGAHPSGRRHDRRYTSPNPCPWATRVDQRAALHSWPCWHNSQIRVANLIQAKNDVGVSGHSHRTS